MRLSWLVVQIIQCDKLESVSKFRVEKCINWNLWSSKGIFTVCNGLHVVTLLDERYWQWMAITYTGIFKVGKELRTVTIPPYRCEGDEVLWVWIYLEMRFKNIFYMDLYHLVLRYIIMGRSRILKPIKTRHASVTSIIATAVSCLKKQVRAAYFYNIYVDTSRRIVHSGMEHVSEKVWKLVEKLSMHGT